jgi:hypothetical protein
VIDPLRDENVTVVLVAVLTTENPEVSTIKGAIKLVVLNSYVNVVAEVVFIVTLKPVAEILATLKAGV